MKNKFVPIEIIESRIFVIRNLKIMIDRDLAELYGVETKALNQAVKRNSDRFPKDFMFKLNDKETKELVTNCDRFKILERSSSSPYAFTEQGVAMLSSVLNSKQAVAINVQIMRTFVKLRELALTNNEISKRLDELEHSFISYSRENNQNIDEIYQHLKYLIEIHQNPKIGFKIDD
ncbi:MAG TPA: DNA-binding protein [Cyanobacteria bacterium UBA9971]|nr:DNA-binding protein [Cyanobacteria bacterium UBA9971]